MKNKKYYHSSRKRIIVDKTHIEDYLADVRHKIQNDLFILAINEKRVENFKLLANHIIDENIVKETISNLTPEDFSNILRNKHKGYEYELLYVFGKTVTLEEKKSRKPIAVPLYIKINNVRDRSVIIISFHEQKYPLTYYFKRHNNE